MGIFDRFRKSDSDMGARSNPIDTLDQSVDPLVVLPVNIMGGRIADSIFTRATNRYAFADSIYNSDERLYSAIELLAIMISKSIGDCECTKIEGNEEEPTNEEKNAVKVADEFMVKMDVKRLFYNYTIDLWKYGDAVDLIKFDSSGIKSLQPLPMQWVTAVDRREQLNKAIGTNEVMIQNPKWYAVDERMTDNLTADQVFKSSRICHISFNPRRNQIKDNMGRWTLNVWSIAPINSLFAIIKWKEQLIRNDMIWSNRALPREHHKLDLSQYDMSKFTGKFSEKEAASKQAAEAVIKQYNENIRRREADQGFVTGRGVEIAYVEPKTTNWQDPSAKLEQIQQLIGGPTGTPSALMGGEGKGFTSLIQATSFLGLRAEAYAKPIQSKMERLIRMHIALSRPGIRKSVRDRITIKNRLILDRDRTELAKMIAVINETGFFTADEIRHIWGLGPLTTKQKRQITAQLKAKQPNQGDQGENLARQNPQSRTAGQESPGARNNNLIQKGDSKTRPKATDSRRERQRQA